jgi:hypothetical protein
MTTTTTANKAPNRTRGFGLRITAETKAAKFSRLASARVTRAVKAINRVGTLASAQYGKTPAQVDKIESYLNAVAQFELRF